MADFEITVRVHEEEIVMELQNTEIIRVDTSVGSLFRGLCVPKNPEQRAYIPAKYFAVQIPEDPIGGFIESVVRNDLLRQIELSYNEGYTTIKKVEVLDYSEDHISLYW